VHLNWARTLQGLSSYADAAAMQLHAHFMLQRRLERGQVTHVPGTYMSTPRQHDVWLSKRQPGLLF